MRSPTAGRTMTHSTGRGLAVALGQGTQRTKALQAGKRPSRNGVSAGNGADEQLSRAELERLLAALEAARDGDFRVRLSATGKGIAGDIYRAFNELADRREAFSKEVARVGRAIG